MDSSYANQATSLPHFFGHYRQRGSGFGVLAAGIGRVALPLVRRFILPDAKRIGRELLKQGIPELVDVVSKKESPKQTMKNTVSNTIKKQREGPARQFQQQPRKQIGSRSKKLTKKRKTSFISKSTAPKRSWSDFLQKRKIIATLLPTEATHSSLDLFEKTSLLVTFDGSFRQKLGPVYSPNSPMLEFEVAGDRNNFFDLQKYSWKSSVKLFIRPKQI